MTQNNIFLSYRRDDIPGYVGRLADELERAYGEQRIFRDVDDISGGTQWRQTIETAIANSQVLILMIGPRWCDIWRERSNEAINYVAFELQLAKEHGVAIIPITFGGATLDRDLDLGEVAWLRQLQQHDISDRQQRWDHDVAGLLKLIEQVPDMELSRNADEVLVPQEKERSTSVWIALFGIAGFLALGLLWVIPQIKNEAGPDRPSDSGPAASPEVEPEGNHQEALASDGTSMSRIHGVWISKKTGLKFQFEVGKGGQFKVIVPGKGRGIGQQVDRVPNKIAFTVNGLGEAEFSLSNSNNKMMGWYRKPGSASPNYDTLIKVDKIFKDVRSGN